MSLLDRPAAGPTVDPLDVVRHALEIHGCSPQPTAKGYKALCPAHDDQRPSLDVARGTRQPVVMTCRANCPTDQVLAAIGLKPSELCEPTTREEPVTYDYTDAAGNLLYQKVRKPGKEFRQRRPDGAGGWVWSLGDTPRVLYRLPQVLEAIAAGHLVWLTEGEKDADTLQARLPAGEVATTMSDGAGVNKWRTVYTDTLADAVVMIVADRDPQGIDHARGVGALLEHAGATVTLVQPRTGKDAHDHLVAGFTPDDFDPLTDPADDREDPTTGTQPDEPGAALGTWAFHDLAVVLAGEHTRNEPTLLRRSDGRCLLYPERINGIHADSGAGKGWIAQQASAEHLAAGGHVVWIDFEDPNAELIVERFLALGVDPDVLVERLHYLNPSDPAGPATIATIVASLEELGECLVVIDSVGESLGLEGLDEDRDLDVDQWKRKVALPFERAGHTVLLIDHATKAKDNPLHPSGSKRKRALISGASWNVEEVVPFDRTHNGKLRLVCAKDRQGNYRRKEVGAWVHVDPTGAVMQVYLEAPADTDTVTSADAETIVVMRRVVAAIHAAGADGLGVTELRSAVRLKARGVRNQTIDDCAVYAAQLGAITVTGGGPGVKKVHRYVRDLTDDDLNGLTDD